jgi:hypothetical protein
VGKPIARESEMKRVVEEFHASGLTRHEFCRQRGIPITTLDYWRRRMQGKPRLVKVKLATPEATAPESFTLRLANGRSIDSCWRFDEEQLARLIRVAEQA